MNSSAVIAATCALLGSFALCSIYAESNSAEAWNRAWQAAATITNDPTDRARTQVRVIERGVRLGIDAQRLDAMARQIEGWQRFDALSIVSTAYLRDGDLHLARKLALEALYRAPLFPPDKRDRITASALWALALLGETKPIEETLSRYQPADKTHHVASAALGLGLLRSGQVEAGLQRLARLEGGHPFEIAGLRMRALELAAAWSTPAMFHDIFQSAWNQSAQESNYRAIDEQLRLIERAAHAGVSIDLSELASDVSRKIDNTPAPRLARCWQWAGLSVAWGRASRPQEARQAAEAARACIADLELIERPAILAKAAVGLAHAGLEDEARDWFSDALQGAKQLINLRPRAIALAEVYLAMADAGIDLEKTARLSPIAASADP